MPWSSAWTRTSASSCSAEAIIESLQSAGEPGQRVAARSCEVSRDPWFNINVGDGFYHYHRAWNDDLSMPFAGIPGYIERVKAGESLERPVEKLRAERQTADRRLP